MADLIYFAIASLDGYVEDADGRFEWGAPDEEVAAFTNDIERTLGTNLYGRRMYETMQYWEREYADEDQPPVGLEFAEMWQRADKVVYSRTLESVSSGRTRIERVFDVDAVRRLKADADADLSIAGAELAGQALRMGLVDQLHLLLVPVCVGGGKRALPEGVALDLELRDQRRFASGFVHLHYAIKGVRATPAHAT